MKVWKRHFRRPDPFTGEQGDSWSALQANFERKLVFAEIVDDFDKVVYFSESLKGIALRFYNSNLSDSEQSSWAQCKRRFQSRFGAPAENAMGRTELASIVEYLAMLGGGVQTCPSPVGVLTTPQKVE